MKKVSSGKGNPPAQTLTKSPTTLICLLRASRFSSTTSVSACVWLKKTWIGGLKPSLRTRAYTTPLQASPSLPAVSTYGRKLTTGMVAGVG